MTKQSQRDLVIDARPRGPNGPLAVEPVLGRPVLDHLLDLAGAVAGDPAVDVAIHARADEHSTLIALVGPHRRAGLRLRTGPPPEHAAILRADRLYDPARLRRALGRGADPEQAAIWRLDRPGGLRGAADELIRRRNYQPLGRFWALGPARALARLLAPTRVRPNAVTLASGGLVLASAVAVGSGDDSWAARGFAASGLALALVLDTADGHLARLQGTASEFGRWLDANLDELGDMALHAAVAWAAFARSGQPAWLVAGMAYAMGKYLFYVGAQTGEVLDAPPTADPAVAMLPDATGRGLVRRVVVSLGHADIRWHLWIVLAALGRLDLALVAYAAYFPLRALLGAARKVARHA